MAENHMPEIKSQGLALGIVTSRRCPTCGHHEVGYETADGAFVSLRPGDRIGVFPRSPAHVAEVDGKQNPETAVNTREKDLAQWAPWVPEPLRRDRALCRMYGVLIERALIETGVSPPLYEMAYRQKLQRLIEKEVDIPLSVILDRRFSAPHLAAANPKQAADALWQELDEISAPVSRVKEWLDDPSDASLWKLIHPKTMDELKGDILTDDQLREELDRISIEDFLGAL